MDLKEDVNNRTATVTREEKECQESNGHESELE